MKMNLSIDDRFISIDRPASGLQKNMIVKAEEFKSRVK
jgi:hypothetical protein